MSKDSLKKEEESSLNNNEKSQTHTIVAQFSASILHTKEKTTLLITKNNSEKVNFSLEKVKEFGEQCPFMKETSAVIMQYNNDDNSQVSDTGGVPKIGEDSICCGENG